MDSYLYRLGIATSVWFNVLLGGSSNQTFSARNYQWQKDHRFNLVFLIDLICGKEHCMTCWSYWMIRKGKW